MRKDVLSVDNIKEFNKRTRLYWMSVILEMLR